MKGRNPLGTAVQPSYAVRMASRVIEIPATTVDQIVAAAGEAGVEDAVMSAIDDRLGNLELVQLLDELEAEAGPVPEALLKEAEDFWRAG